MEHRQRHPFLFANVTYIISARGWTSAPLSESGPERLGTMSLVGRDSERDGEGHQGWLAVGWGWTACTCHCLPPSPASKLHGGTAPLRRVSVPGTQQTPNTYSCINERVKVREYDQRGQVGCACLQLLSVYTSRLLPLHPSAPAASPESSRLSHLASSGDLCSGGAWHGTHRGRTQFSWDLLHVRTLAP